MQACAAYYESQVKAELWNIGITILKS